METQDNTFISSYSESVSYGGFWPRAGALAIDTLIIGPISFLFSYFNVVSWKSIPLLFVIATVVASYKLLSEYFFSATPGKMLLKLRIVDYALKRPTLKHILLRNIFHVGFMYIGVWVSLKIYSAPEFHDITGYWEFIEFSKRYTVLRTINLFHGLVLLIEVVCMFTENERRTWHDRIGRTFVIAL